MLHASRIVTIDPQGLSTVTKERDRCEGGCVGWEGGRGEGGEVGDTNKKNRSVSYYVHGTSSIAPSLCPVGKACPGFTCFVVRGRSLTLWQQGWDCPVTLCQFPSTPALQHIPTSLDETCFSCQFCVFGQNSIPSSYQRLKLTELKRRKERRRRKKSGSSFRLRYIGGKCSNNIFSFLCFVVLFACFS